MVEDEEQVDDALLVSVFRLGEALFGIPAAQIQEVVQVGSLTPVHHAPECVAGIRNLRGRIVTVVDLKSKLQLGRVEHGTDSRILMVDSDGELVGLLVERVEDTIFLDTRTVSPAPTGMHGLQGPAFRGVYRFDGRLLSLLDHSHILSAQLENVTRP